MNKSIAPPAIKGACRDCGGDIVTPGADRCWDCARVRERRRELRDASTIPARFMWASFASPALAQRVKDPSAIAKAKDAASRDVSVVVLGSQAGIGKTSIATAITSERRDRLDTPAHFVDGLELGSARARERLGIEAPLVKRAMHAKVLVVDEVLRGRGGHGDALTDVCFARHNSNLATIVTASVASPEELRRKLDDDGLFRRLVEGAAVIVVGASAPAQAVGGATR